MPVVSTDDEARRLRYIYLGPEGFRFPFDARFPAIGLALALTAASIMLAYLLNPPGMRLWLLSLVVGPVAAIIATRRIMRHVDHDRPLRWWIHGVVKAEFITPRPLPTERTAVQITPIPHVVPDPVDTIFQEAHRAQTAPSSKRRPGHRARR